MSGKFRLKSGKCQGVLFCPVCMNPEVCDVVAHVFTVFAKTQVKDEHISCLFEHLNMKIQSLKLVSHWNASNLRRFRD